MSEDKSRSNGNYRQRIDHELRGWNRRLDVSHQKLKRAVAKLGDRPDAQREQKSNA